MKNLLSKIAFFTSTSVLSGFIWVNVWEKVTLSDLPMVPSVSQTTLPNIIHQVKESSNLDQKTKFGFFGQPIIFRVPRLNFSINLAESKKQGDKWLVTNGTASLEVYGAPQGGNIGDSVIFTLPNSGLLSVADVLVEGDRIVLDTKDNWRYNFRVTKRSIIDSPYLVSHSSITKLLIIKEKNEKVVVVESSLLNVEELLK